MSYLAIAKAVEARLKAERSRPDLALATVYWRYWDTSETEPLTTFQAILAEIATLEARLDPGKVIDILESEAQRFHQETGRCPHCRQVGTLHHEPEGNEPR